MAEHNEMTRHAFRSHMEEYMRQLLQDPLHADTDDFLKRHGIDAPTALRALTDTPDSGNPESAVVIAVRRIKDNGSDAKGVRNPDTFTVRYRVVRNGYADKMRRLYIRMFENNIPAESPLNEGKFRIFFGKNGMGLTDEILKIGRLISALSRKYHVYLTDSHIDALDDVYDLTFLTQRRDDSAGRMDEGAWNYGILDNDDALDRQTEFAKNAIDGLCSKLGGNDMADLWSWFGVMYDFLNKYRNNEIAVTDEYREAVRKCIALCDKFEEIPDFVSSWEDKEKIMNSIDKCRTELKRMYGRETVDEEISGGATAADASGQYSQPLFGKPVRRRIYITQEQEEELRRILREESVVDTSAGDFGYDAPVGDGRKNKGNPFYKEANDHNGIISGGIPR